MSVLPVRRLVLPALLLVTACSSEPPEPGQLTYVRTEPQIRFEKLVSGCLVEGRASVADAESAPASATLRIDTVTVQDDGTWRVDASVVDGGETVPMPFDARVQWRDGEPVIEIASLEVPGEPATYSARVTLDPDAHELDGTWSGGGREGAVSGKLVRNSWRSWRGFDDTGVARTADPPTEWSEDENIRWKVEIPGDAGSSPVIWHDRVFVTTAIDTGVQGRTPPPKKKKGRGPVVNVFEFAVLALDRADGSVVWQTVVAEEVPHEAVHPTATQASASPITDGTHVYAHFGSRGLHCLDMDGEIVWSVDFGEMHTRARFGEGSSPALRGEMLVVNWDHQGDSFVVALDKRNGNEIWRRDRDEATTWTTPIIAPVGGEPQVVITATEASRGYDLATGKELWHCGGMTDFCVASPVCADGIVYLMSGFQGHALQAIRLAGAQGDLSGSDHLVWTYNRNTSYAPSPLLYDDKLYFFRINNGVLSCLDAETGEVHYEGQRLRGIREAYSSPVGAAGRVYLTGRGGTTFVIEHGPEFRKLAVNELDDEGFDASAAVVGNELYLRGRDYLYCIAEPED